LEKLKAVLLVGGLGTRLRPLTNDRPKSIVPVLNRPVLEHTLAYLKFYGIRDIVITLNYMPEVIEDYFGDGERFGVKLTYFMEEEPRGTAGAVKNAESYLDGSFFVLNGDVFTDMNLADMLAFHRKKKAQATIALTYVENPSAFGVVETNDKGKVQRFIEKPPPGTETTNWINAGTYILERNVLDVIPPGCNYMFERGLFPQMLQTGRPVYGYPYKGYWLDMGTPASYYTISKDFMSSRINNLLYKNIRNTPQYNKKSVNIHKSVVIKTPAVIDDGCSIGEDVQIIGPVVIGRDCRIKEHVIIEDTIIWDGVTIGANTRVKGCIISSGTVIGENQIIENSIITPGQILPLANTISTQK
jgi:mannose-1-phosphate guanylyltransferase